MKDYYAILGVPRNATEHQVRTRFRQLARDRHPDRFSAKDKPKAEAEFQAITEAYNVLIQPELRRRHDLDLARPAGQSQSEAGEHARVYLQRGIKAYKEKNYLAAAENFDRATKFEPDNARAWHHLAMACSHQRRWLSRAMKAIAAACELEPMNATYLKLAGRLFAEAGLVARAEQYYSRAQQWGGDDPSIQEALDALRKKEKSGLFGRSG